MEIDSVAVELIRIYPVLAESINTKPKKIVPLPSIPDLGITTESVTIAVGGHMTIRKWISTANPFTNAAENASRHKPGFSHHSLPAQLRS